ncbi:MAG: hypothetical protein RLZZ234_343 [Candidatus Parcubacteria bacterium]|jgi:hypothetical protein
MVNQVSQFVIHSCEQVLRFSSVPQWNDLSEERKIQLSFNLGAMVHALALSKEEGWDQLNRLRNGNLDTAAFKEHIQSIVDERNVAVDLNMVNRPI